ncbi:hypothetical protein [Mycobacterium sp. MMS18-G62]
MYVDRLAVLPIRLCRALEFSFGCVGCAASASADVFGAAKSRLQRVSTDPPPTRTEDIADVIVFPRGRKRER